MNGSDDHLVRCDDDDGGAANSDSDESFYGFDNEDRQLRIMSDLSDPATNAIWLLLGIS